MVPVEGAWRRGRAWMVAGLLAAVAAALVALEGSARLYWKVRWGIPLTRPRTVLNALYPELSEVEWKDRDLVRFGAASILLLGGSVLHRRWGNVERELRERLTATLHRPVAIYNMAAIGHTSRDSYVKYRALADRRVPRVVRVVRPKHLGRRVVRAGVVDAVIENDEIEAPAGERAVFDVAVA